MTAWVATCRKVLLPTYHHVSESITRQSIAQRSQLCFKVVIYGGRIRQGLQFEAIPSPREEVSWRVWAGNLFLVPSALTDPASRL